MKNVLLLLLNILIGISSAFSQSSNEPIIIDDAIIGHHYYHGDVQVFTVSKMKAIVAKDQLALKEVKKAVVPEIMAYAFTISGGIITGLQLGSLLYGQFNPYMLASGIGLAAIGFGFSAIVDKHLIKGTTLYNNNLGVTSFDNNIKLDFGLTPNGVGIMLSF